MIELILGAAALFFLTKKKNGSDTTTTTPADKNGRPGLKTPANPSVDRTRTATGSTSQGSGVNTQQSAGSGKRNRPTAV